MKDRKEGGKKPDPFVVTWDMVVYVPLYALLLLAIFAGISALMIWGLDQVAFQQGSIEEKSALLNEMKDLPGRVRSDA